MFNERVRHITELARQARFEGNFDNGFNIIKDELSKFTQYDALVWQHQPLFWSPIVAGNYTLTRRDSSDADFVESLWGDSNFRRRFHRQALDLPPRVQLEKLLKGEFLSLIGESKALHWIIRDKVGQAQGLLSLTEISMQHRRAEVLLGLSPKAPLGIGVAAMFMLFQFFFRTMKFYKLVSMIYTDNDLALKTTVHLGFRIEGILRGHMLDPASGHYVDMYQLALLESEAFRPANQRVMSRMLTQRISRN
jgi:RimJ/RimL family protein N-acetyltransferase